MPGMLKMLKMPLDPETYSKFIAWDFKENGINPPMSYDAYLVSMGYSWRREMAARTIQRSPITQRWWNMVFWRRERAARIIQRRWLDMPMPRADRAEVDEGGTNDGKYRPTSPTECETHEEAGPYTSTSHKGESLREFELRIEADSYLHGRGFPKKTIKAASVINRMSRACNTKRKRKRSGGGAKRDSSSNKRFHRDPDSE